MLSWMKPTPEAVPEVTPPTPDAGLGWQDLGNAALNDLIGQGWLPDLGEWFGGGDQDEGEVQIPEQEPVRGPDSVFPIFGPEPWEPGPKDADGVVQEHLSEYISLLELAFDDPALGSFDFGEDTATLSTALFSAWVKLGDPSQDTRTAILAVEDALHAAAMGALVQLHPDEEEQKAIAASFGRAARKLLESTVYARVASPEAYGLAYPSAAVLGVAGVDVAAAMAKGRDEVVAVGPDGNEVPAEVGSRGTVQDRASHLAALLAVETLPAEHVAGAHEDTEILYTGAHAQVIAAAGLPATAAEVYQQLQAKSAFVNQRDNANREEEADGGTCNLSSVAMAMQAAGVVTPHAYRGVVLEGMQFEERLVAIAYQDGLKNLLSSDTWSHVVRACGGTFEDLQMGGLSTWEQWQVVQTEHLDKGHGVIVSNNGHVLRIQSVDEAGLTIDDPYSHGSVKETEDNAGQIKGEFHHELPAPEEDEEVEEQPPAPVEDRVVTTAAWRQGGKLWAAYDPATEAFSEELTDALKDEKLREVAAAETDTEAEHWSLVQGGKIKFSGNRDRTVGKKNTRTRDQDGEDYERGEDTEWSKDGAVGHHMNGVWAIYR